MKFKIIPKKNIEFFEEGENAGDALVNFATHMDTDMNLYFEAVPVHEETDTKGWEIVKKADAGEQLKAYELGQLSFSADKVCITDPCYDSKVWCRMNDVPIVPGNYTCVVYFSDEGEWGWRVAKIGIYRDSKVREEMAFEHICHPIGSIGVDAGLAGIFQDKPDFTDEQWSDFCNDIRDGDAWLVSGRDMRGFFSRSGYGDGGYDVYAHSSSGMCSLYDGLEIVFICDDEDSEDGDNED